MLILGSTHLRLKNFRDGQSHFIFRVSTDPRRPVALCRDELFQCGNGEVPEGYAAYAYRTSEGRPTELPPHWANIGLPDDLVQLEHGDIVRIDTLQNAIRILYRRQSKHNAFLVTERCNHYCLMCSQPPRNVDDDWLIDEMMQAIPLMALETEDLGFTGGEPTLLGDRFLDVLNLTKGQLPSTSVHILSNGRSFADANFARKYASIEHPDMMVGIPLYSDVSTIHDYVVQSDGAFDETVRGILNLKRLGQKVEIRVVIHKQTYQRLPQLAEFLARNLTFVDHIALMGLEITGFTRANLPDLWIDPWDYRDQLRNAVFTLADNRMNVSVYNHQLCIIDREIRPFARQSISDWKNEYMPECDGCALIDQCGGFFSSAIHGYSDHIGPITDETHPV
jgi:His-Xaa-Ser system radical SAM maturase HxsC